MIGPKERRERGLAALREARDEAMLYFSQVDSGLFDGYQTAHDVLAHLVFWQCEHVAVALALVDGREPDLKRESLPELNRRACDCRRDYAMEDLLAEFGAQYEVFNALLRQLPDWEIAFPIREGCRYCTVEDRAFALAAHIHYHIAMLRRAALRHAEGFGWRFSTHPLSSVN